MKLYRFTLKGRPVTKKRPRFFHGKEGQHKVYNPTDDDEFTARCFIMSWMNRRGYTTIDETCEVHARCYFKGGNVGDVDNYLHFVIEVLQGKPKGSIKTLIKNDKLVWKATVEKHMVETKDEERTEVEIKINGGEG